MSVRLDHSNGRSRVLPRSRLGCKTCKIRRVKCGEEKPSCVRCTSTGRKCDFEDTPPPSSTVSAIANPLSLSPNTNTVWRERRAFAYYFEFAASSIGGGLDVDFWRTVVPQVCRYEPAVWDAIITISALFECPKECLDPASKRRGSTVYLTRNHRDALGWYSRSVSAVRQRIEQGSVDVFVGLISCVLFICIEAIQGNPYGAMQLYCQGVQLIIALRPQIASGAASNASLLEDTIIPIFVRLGAFGLASGESPVTALLRDTEHAFTQQFDSLKSAREAIVLLTIEIPLFEGACTKHLLRANTSHVPDEFNTKLFSLMARLRNWHTAFDKLMRVLRANDMLSLQQIGTGALLLSYHDMLYVMLQTCTSLSLMQFDAYLPNFQNIVEQCANAPKASVRPDGTQPPFTFEVNVVLPLWFTSLRCREPRTRRAALALLHQAPSVQGFYERSIWVSVGRTIMEIEESRAMAMNVAHHTSNLGALEPTGGPIPGSELAPISYSAQTDMGPRIPTALYIPEEVRIGPIAAFRPMDGFPPGTTEADIVKWNRGPDQLFLRFSRTERGLTSDSSRMVYEYVPLDF
ncbi:DNA repair protein rad10 [Penicillium cf. griseofulvum]|uniref:DNA repair protein rad10 n=1 Tax=Penicillium cf. griseofulvum TaxID=2972120 RepID=A0A9W9M9G5_9EURO|nr:DNA repair protein rad10 [Penicillium cf. griseofulvum]KAJ5444923.1 DNA repair protein rad10 [Penicillium cf. griseofulvum]KAJ5446637.1 DNA repair protein rad10 [Penicillium cf. griseofulvum]